MHPRDILFTYQQQDALSCVARKRFCLFNDPGTGKTWTALRAAELGGAKYVLVICPKSMVPVWRKELKLWGLNGEAITYNRIGRDDYTYPTGTDCVIADESHNLKNWAAKRTVNFFINIARHIKYVWLLTGTPALRSNEDLHPTLSFMEPGKWGKLSDFRDKYCFSKKITVKYSRGGKINRIERDVYYGFKNNDILNEALKRVGVRRTLEEVSKALPPVMTKTIDCDVPNSLKSRCKDSLNQEDLDPDILPPSISALFPEIGLEKVSVAVELAETFGDKPFLIFANHHSVIDALKSEIKKTLDIGVESIDGRTAEGTREKYVEQFQAGHINCLILQNISAGVGITLTKASYAIFIERPWSPELYKQCVGRIRRIGQTATVLNVYNLVAPKTLDDLVTRKLTEKTKGIQELTQ